MAREGAGAGARGDALASGAVKSTRRRPFVPSPNWNIIPKAECSQIQTWHSRAHCRVGNPHWETPENKSAKNPEGVKEREGREGERRGKCWNILQATCKKIQIYIQYERFLLSYLFFEIFFYFWLYATFLWHVWQLLLHSPKWELRVNKFNIWHNLAHSSNKKCKSKARHDCQIPCTCEFSSQLREIEFVTKKSIWGSSSWIFHRQPDEMFIVSTFFYRSNPLLSFPLPYTLCAAREEVK